MRGDRQGGTREPGPEHGLLIAGQANAASTPELPAAWEAVFAALSDAVIVYDAAGNVVRANPAAVRAYGLDPGALSREQGIQRLAIRRADGRTVTQEELPSTRALRGESVVQERYVFTNAQGHDLTILASASPLLAGSRVQGAVAIWHDITEQVMAEEARRQSEERMRLVLANSPDTVFIQDRDLRYTMIINPSSPASETDVLGRTDFDLLPEAQARPLAELKRRVMDTGISERVEILLSPGGIERWYDAAYEPLRDARGKVVGVGAYSRDITERKRAEAEREQLLAVAQQQSAQLRALLQNLGEGVTILDGEGQVVMHNQAMEAITGFASQQVPDVGDYPLSMLRLDGSEIPRDEWPSARILADGQPFTGCEFIQQRADGTRRRVISSGSAVRNEQGEIALAIVVSRDVSALRELEAEHGRLLDQLRAANERLVLASLQARDTADVAEGHRLGALQHAAQLEALLSSLNDAVTVVDAGGNVVLRNPASASLFAIAGAERCRALESGWARLLWPDGTEVAKADRPIDRLLRGETVADAEYILERKDGSKRFIASSGGTVRDDEGRVVLAILVNRDISELRRLEEQREDFLRSISHDLRQPLTIVVGQAQWLHGHLMKAGLEREAKGAEAIVKSSRRMSNMVTDLVESARLEAGRLELQRSLVDPYHLLCDVVERVTSPADLSRLSVEAPEFVPPLLVDPQRLERALTNLIANALTYSPPQSPVYVRLTQVGNEACIAVADRGVGIPATELPNLFERYYRASTGKGRDGSGLGLYISRLIVEAHGGRIRVQSEVGQGSCFTIHLPLAGE